MPGTSPKRISLQKTYDYLFAGRPGYRKEISEEEFTKSFGEPSKFFEATRFIDPKNLPAFVKKVRKYSKKEVDDTIEKAFATANDKYKYFTQDDKQAFEIYEACYLITQYSWHILGSKSASSYDGTSAESDIEFLAYKMLVIFGGEDVSSTLSRFDEVAKATSQSQSLQTKGLLRVDIPICTDYGAIKYNLDEVKDIVCNEELTHSILRFFTTLPKIQNKYGKVANDLEQFKDQLIGVTIPNAEENFKLAKLCYEYKAMKSFDPIMQSMKMELILLTRFVMICQICM